MGKKSEYLEHESLQDSATVIGYLQALIEGIQAGKIEISDEEDSQTLTPSALTLMSIKARKTKQEQTLRLRLKWHSELSDEAEESALSIEPQKTKSRKLKK